MIILEIQCKLNCRFINKYADGAEDEQRRKRKMKTLELNSKEDFQYYLYQLICRSYKLIRQQDIYLLRLDNYICQKQRENVLMVTKIYLSHMMYTKIFGFIRTCRNKPA